MKNDYSQSITAFSGNILKYSGLVFFLLMLAAPFQYYVVKVIVISLLAGLSLINIYIFKKINLAKPVFVWFVTFLGFGIFFSASAFFISTNNVNDLFRAMPVNVVWPIAYFLVIPFIHSRRIITLIHKVLLLATYIISLYLLAATLSYLGFLPVSPTFFASATPVLGKYESSVSIFAPATTALLFAIPFLLTYLLLQIYQQDKVKSMYVIIALLLGIAAIIVTARRSLMLNLLVSPVLIFVFLSITRIKLQKAAKRKVLQLFVSLLIVCVIGCLIMVKYELLNLDSMFDFFKGGFDFSSTSQDQGSLERGEQVTGLMHSWLDYPILGSGLGSSSQYTIRSYETPWVYELSYLTLLFQTGLVGVTIYFGLLFWIFYKGLNLIRYNTEFVFIIPSLVGCFCFLLGNASNPYLVAFDNMWAIFLPVGLINYCYFKNAGKLDI